MQEHGYFHTFPAVQGTQAGKDFFIAMCPLRMVPRLFVFDEEEVPPELRAQRTLNRSRVPKIAEYLVLNPKTYILSALTASVDAQVQFRPLESAGQGLGLLQIPMDARILINDGQHRRAAIEEAIKQNPELGQDNVPVLFFVDEGLDRSQQMFADLNKHAVQPSPSIGLLYDRRDRSADLARYLAFECTAFKSLTEMERSTISNRSTKLFTLSSIRNASRALLRRNENKEEYSLEDKMLAKEFWEAVAEQIPDWSRARTREISTSELRQNFVHAHGVLLQALGIAGAALLAARPKNWKVALKALRNIDWSRTNTSVWEGRVMLHGRISKASVNVQLTSNLLKQKFGLQLSEEDELTEKKWIAVAGGNRKAKK